MSEVHVKRLFASFTSRRGEELQLELLESVELSVNGVRHTLEAGTIQDVIAHFNLTGKPVIVEADGVILTPEQWTQTTVFSGMIIELVHFVGGG
ncbi:Sulfur carrier protein ThiS [compost metagenome]